MNNCHFVIPIPAKTILYKEITHEMSFTGSFLYTRKNEKENEIQTTILYRTYTVKDTEQAYIERSAEKIERWNEQEKLAANQEGRKPKKKYPPRIERSNYGNDRVILYRDEQMHDKLAAEYRSNIGYDRVHTQEEYEKLEPMFGVIVLRLNDPEITAEAAYLKYKKRWRIETFYNHIRNDVDFNATHIENYYTQQGIAFIMVIESLIYSRFINAIKDSKVPYIHGMSVREALLKAGKLKVSLERDGHWHANQIKGKHITLFTEFGADINSLVQKLNALL